MKITTLLLSTLCLICLCIPGNVPLGAQQTTSLQIDVTNSSTLLQGWHPSADTSLTFEIEVTVPADFSSGTLTASLQNVTNYLGISGNAVTTTQEPTQAEIDNYNIFKESQNFSEPVTKVVASTDQSDDLQIRQTNNTGWTENGSSLTHSLGANTNTISLCVDCLDYAAYGELVLTASGSGYTSNTVTVQIPTDTNGNKIADSWRNDATLNYGRDDDNDTGPNTRKGDNITVINEYRGYHNNGSWTDTDPNAWDVFVKLDTELDTGGYSISDAYALPMNVHEAPWVAMGDGIVYPHEIEASGGTAPSVYAVRVQGDAADVKTDDKTEEVLDDILGSAGIGPPWYDIPVTIYYNRVEHYVEKGTFVDNKKVDYVNSTIAHEIGHAVNLGHCPCFDDLDCRMWNPPDGVTHHVSGYASHHKDDYNLVFDGYFWPREAAPNSHISRIFVEGVGIRERKVEDVNEDGVVNVQDLVIIALNLGISVPHIANVNGDDAVDVQDLVMVADAITTTGSVCFTSLREDVNEDGVVDISDLVQVASKIGSADRVNSVIAEDVDSNGVVNETDLDLVAAAFGNTVAADAAEPTEPVPEPSFSPSASYAVSGRTVSFTITAGAPIYGTYLWFSGEWYWHGVSGSANTQTLSHTIPATDVQNTYTFGLYVYPRVGETFGEYEEVWHYVRLEE